MLGGGSYGVVYRVSDAAQREYAAKVIPTPDRELRRRCVREARLALRLRHPRVVAARACLDQDPRRLGLVLDLIPGPSLEQRLQRGVLSEAETLRLILQVGEGLAFCHGERVVHRDVKPGNVLWGRDGWVLCDLGLARPIDSSTLLTEPGQFVGTFAYLAPEVILEQAVSPAADVFSLAGTAHRALCGEVPFPAHDALELMQQVVHDEPSGLRRAGSVSRGLVSLLEDMFEKDPADRPSIAEVQASAERLLGGG